MVGLPRVSTKLENKKKQGWRIEIENEYTQLGSRREKGTNWELTCHIMTRSPAAMFLAVDHMADMMRLGYDVEGEKGKGDSFHCKSENNSKKISTCAHGAQL